MVYLPVFAVLLWLTVVSGLLLLFFSTKKRLDYLEAWQKAVEVSFKIVEQEVKRFDIETYRQFHTKAADLEASYKRLEDSQKLLSGTVDKLIARAGAEASAEARRARKDEKAAQEAVPPSQEPFSAAKALALSLGYPEDQAQLWALQVVNPQPPEAAPEQAIRRPGRRVSER